jgi:hypothetical protein
MADPITLDEAIDDLTAAWGALGMLTHRTRPPITLPDGSQGTRANAAALRAACLPVLAPEGQSEAPPEATAVRDSLHRFVWGEWHRHPVARAMFAEGMEVRGHGAPPPRDWADPRHLADLDALPDDAPERSAVLTATAYTARQERDRLTAAPSGANAATRRRLRRQSADLAEHYAAAMARLPAAFDAWLPDAVAVIETAHKPGAVARPTVPAVIRAGVGPTTE